MPNLEIYGTLGSKPGCRGIDKRRHGRSLPPGPLPNASLLLKGCDLTFGSSSGSGGKIIKRVIHDNNSILGVSTSTIVDPDGLFWNDHLNKLADRLEFKYTNFGISPMFIHVWTNSCSMQCTRDSIVYIYIIYVYIYNPIRKLKTLKSPTNLTIRSLIWSLVGVRHD